MVTRAEPHPVSRQGPDSAGPGVAEAVLGDLLVAREALHPLALQAAVAGAARLRLPLAEVLRAEAAVAPPDLTRALADLARMPVVDPAARAPDARLIARIGAPRCLAMGLVPLGRIGGETWIAFARPEGWARHGPDLARIFGPIRPCLATEAAVQAAVSGLCAAELRQRAEARVPERFSTRAGRAAPRTERRVLAALALGALFWAAPLLPLALLLGWLVLALTATSVLRAGALVLALRGRAGAEPPPGARPLRLPVISILVPLYGEPDIAPRLLQRLGRLDYPRALLDVLIVLEARDTATRAALAACRLPGWMRVVVVPDGRVTTKPRAMNYALDFCRGSIVGIYDAEDAPDPDQLRKVVRRFAARGPEVACLQGALDYYNPRTNLIARLFTAEYASWFRVVMPALQRLGLPMPLGGTTLFLRREAIERVGAWDAHNVTEDADLGVRLARHGLRTEMLDTTTHEEANCRLRPWVRQRSRWIKGHLLTWAVHMRDPRALRRDLGWRGFLGYQLVFLGAQSQVLLAPLMWSFWLMLFGLPHPAQALLPPGALMALSGLFVGAEMLVIATALVGLARTRHRRLWLAVPLLHLYHPLGAVAGWRALWEAVRNPFYWAKTSHGHFDHAAEDLPPGTAPPESAADRIARTLGQPVARAPVIAAQRVRNSPASIFSRVSKAREICVRSAS